MSSPVHTGAPTLYLDFTLIPGAQVHHPGFGDPYGLSVWNWSAKPLSFVLVGVKPLGEPIVGLGGFVTNKQEEIDEPIRHLNYCSTGSQNHILD